MNDHEAERLAAAAHQLRPDWPTSSVLTLIRKNLMDRPRRDVSVALAWIACESNTATPARILESGPWWRAAGVEGATSKREQVDPAHRCSICSEDHDRCRRIWADDHEFVSAVEAARQKAGPEAVSAAIAAIKDGIEPTKEPEPMKTLDNLAERNPKLKARVDALRAALPKGLPKREPEPPPTPGPEPESGGEGGEVG